MSGRRRRIWPPRRGVVDAGAVGARRRKAVCGGHICLARGATPMARWRWPGAAGRAARSPCGGHHRAVHLQLPGGRHWGEAAPEAAAAGPAPPGGRVLPDGRCQAPGCRRPRMAAAPVPARPRARNDPHLPAAARPPPSWGPAAKPCPYGQARQPQTFLGDFLTCRLHAWASAPSMQRRPAHGAWRGAKGRGVVQGAVVEGGPALLAAQRGAATQKPGHHAPTALRRSTRRPPIRPVCRAWIGRWTGGSGRGL